MDGQVPLRHATVRRIFAVQRILGQVVTTHYTFTPERGTKKIGVARHREFRKRLSQRSGTEYNTQDSPPR